MTRNDRKSQLEVVWHALECYREDSIPEGNEDWDNEWNDICTAMAWITEDLEQLEG